MLASAHGASPRSQQVLIPRSAPQLSFTSPEHPADAKPLAEAQASLVRGLRELGYSGTAQVGCDPTAPSRPGLVPQGR